ncbi:MAG: hypothetical protein EON90_05275 [Brevundimonas sp.]|nr:MAG: hypothetical protein EON90_05275 [Brevundimonas sp.]
MLRRLSLAVLAATALTPFVAAAQTLAPTAVTSIDPTVNDFSDLEPLGRDIGDARIVILGEPSHGEGAAFIAKARVIRYLHERMGFDVLAFESGIGVVGVADDKARAGGSPGEALSAAVMPVWGRSDQFRPLADYLDRTAQAGRPMTLAGIDFQEVGPVGADLAEQVAGLAARLPTAAEPLERLSDHLRAVSENGMRALAGRDTTSVSADVDTIQAALVSLPASEGDRWRQQLASLDSFFTFMRRIGEGTPEVFNSRDVQMASNLHWLADRAPDRKIIVWAATSHALKDRGAIDPAADATSRMVPMGAHIHRIFGDDAYVLAFTGGGGRIGSWARRTETDIGSPPEGSLEAELLQSPHAYAFSALAPSAERRLSWMLGYEPMPAYWDRAVDGVFFIREMTPTSYATVPAPAGRAQ